MLTEIIQAAIFGLSLGSIYGLSASGFTVTYGILNFFNVAHGDMITAGAYIAFVINVIFGQNLILAFIGAMVFAALLGMLLDHAFYRRLGRFPVPLLLVSIGVGMIIRNSILAIWGPKLLKYEFPVFNSLRFLDFSFSQLEILVIIVAFVTMVLMHSIIQRTDIGRNMRAAADSLNLAEISGINTKRVITSSWIMSGALAGVAGVMAGMVTNLTPDFGFHFILVIFAAAILGGAGNIYGAFCGGVIIGIAEEIGIVFIDPGYKPAIGFAVLIIAIFVRHFRS